MTKITTRFQPLERDVLLRFAVGMSPEEQSAALVEFAAGVIAEAEASNEAVLGRATPYETIVDGARGVPLSSVKPNGAIVAIFDLGSDVIQWIFDELRRTAPVLTGAFKESIAVYVDGAEVSGPPAIPPGAREVVFVATVPYARKIERGQSRMAKDGVFEAVSALARRRFGNIANIRFSYRSPLGGDTRLEKWARAKNRAKRGQAARDRRQPAIIVSLR